MKRKTILLSALAIGAMTMIGGTLVAGGGEKVEVCHKGAKISISVSALPAHLAHGDVLPGIPGTGTCFDGSDKTIGLPPCDC